MFFKPTNIFKGQPPSKLLDGPREQPRKRTTTCTENITNISVGIYTIQPTYGDNLIFYV